MKFYFYCESFRRDIERVKVLAASFAKYNTDKLPFVIGVPKSDMQLFQDAVGYTAEIIDDETIFKSNLPGWVHQQVVKASFWKVRECDAYMMLDSDCYFIKPFGLSDFMHESGVPYTVIHEQKDLFDWSCNKSKALGFDPQESFAECRNKVMELFGRTGKLYDFGPAPAIWSSKVWKSLEDDYLTPNGLTLADAIKEVPSEYTWYGEWLLTNQTIPLWPIEPLFKHFHYPQQYTECKRDGYTEADFSKIWYGVVMQSNWGAPLKY